MRPIPTLPRLPPKAITPGDLRPHDRGSPRSQWTQVLFDLAKSGIPQF